MFEKLCCHFLLFSVRFSVRPVLSATFRETCYEVHPITVQQAAILKMCRFTFFRESSMSVVKKGKDLLELWSGNKIYIHSICRTHF